jgi:Domain of unknown function (DUF4175)
MRDSERRQTHNRILDVVRSVRWRWRARLALRGLVWVVAIAGSVVFLSALGLEQLRFSAESVVWLRALTWGTVTLSFILFFVRPLLRKVTDTQVALYLEEHEPSLEHVVTSVLDEGSGMASPALSQRVTEIALEKARRVEYGRHVEQSGLYRFAGALTVLVVLAVTTSLLGPEYLRLGISALLRPTTDAAAVNPYSVAVTPGDATIARGTDQMVGATLGGFDAADASIFTRGESDQSFQRLSMLRGLEGGFEVLLLGVPEPTEYFVESNGVRSPTFTIDVADLPYVDRLDLTYYFPGYTGLSARIVEDGGDVVALAGTLIELHIEPTMLTPAGRLLLDGEVVDDLTVEDDGTLSVRFTVREDGFYSLELARTDNGDFVDASPEYRIDVLTDLPPSVNFSRPGRDMPASAIEEVYLEMTADDDYGVGDVRLVYSVNGGLEDTVTVFRAGSTPLAEVSAGHTLYLEEWDLEVGDLISYYAIARDNRSARTAQVVTSDIYFLSVRPFERAYRQAEQQGGGGGGGGAETALSETQRQVIAATFNLIRQEDSYSPDEFSENINSVGLAQERLQDQISTLLQRMQNRGLTETDPGFRDVSAVLPLADSAMTLAREALDDERLRDALSPEQGALRYLQQAEETYERYVQEQQGGGGGGGGQQAAEDLADLFELELDKMKNQYETVQRGEQQQADNQVDELLQQLEELARRQEQQAERQRRASRNQNAGTGNGEAQRGLADETEEAARQLQRLAREMGDQNLEQTARELQQAAESMRQSAAASGSQASADASTALRGLEDARRALQDARADRARRDAEDAIADVEELQGQQRNMQRDVRGIPTERGPERQTEIERLRDRKEQMVDAVEDLERRMDSASGSVQADNPQAAREMAGAADLIRESKLKEKLFYTRGTIEQWDPESAVTMELQIEGDLQALRDQLERALNASSQRTEDPLREALDDTRDLVRGLEAMDRRLNEQGQSPDGQREGQGGQDQRAEGQGPDGDGQGQDAEGQNGQDQRGEGQAGQGQNGRGQEGESQEGEGQGGRGGDGEGRDGQGQNGEGAGDPQGQRGDAERPGGGADNQGRVGIRSGTPRDGAAGGTPRQFTPEEVRQFQSEFRERSGQVVELRQGLRDAGRSAEELDEVLAVMRRFQDADLFTDAAALASLQDDILNRLQRLEFGLRRDVEGEADRRATLTGADDVPDGYRRLVEKYYRSLARGGSGPGGR